MGPHTSLGDESKALGRVVGTWDVEYVDFLKDGTVTHRSGEFIVGWVLDGRAVQDLWIVDASGAGKDREQSSDGGKTWRLKSEYHMKRRGGPHLRSYSGAGLLARWPSSVIPRHPVSC
jgi:hypothetical protein